MRMYVYEKETEGNKFYYTYVGKETHGKPTYVVWLSKNLLKSDENGRLFVETPIKGCDIKQGKKPTTLILKPGNLTLYYFIIECGYRGNSYIDEIIAEEPVQTYNFDEYKSERGSLGISSGALILTKANKIKISWSRSGRLYGKPAHGITVLYSDGKIEQLTDTDLEELAELQEEKV